MSEQEFPEVHWEEMRDLMTSAGPAGVIEFIKGFKSDLERRQLFALTHKGFSYRDWNGKNFDDLITVVEAGITEGLTAAKAAGDEETRAKRIDYANVLAYNLAADLAECWPGDETKREKNHFEKGVALGERCLAWRKELKKGPGPFSMAYWVKGMHHLSLGQAEQAERDLTASLEKAVAAAKEQEKNTECIAGGDFSIVLGYGYLGLAKRIKGNGEGDDLYRKACKAFSKTIDEFPDQKEDAQFGLDQLRQVESKLAKQD